MNPTLDVPPQALEHWQRLALGIRLAYEPQQPVIVRRYLALGHLLVQQGLLTSRRAWPRMLELLLQTAVDEALPWFWRNVCLEHSAMPLARCAYLHRRGGLDTLPQLQARVDAARVALSTPTCATRATGAAR
jgi:hypothetical protein